MTETTPTTSPSVVRGVRRAAIIAVIASLVIAALLGILALLSGELGELQAKVLLTTLMVAAFGTTALCHLAIVTRSVRVVGFLGIAASLGAAVCALVLIWTDWSASWDRTGLLKALAVLAIAAASLAQVNLLLLLAGRRQPLIRIALWATVAAVGAVAIMVVIPILTEGEVPGGNGEWYWRLLGVLAILDALGTIALPILGLVLRRAGAAPASAGLVLRLPAELAERIDRAASPAGLTREQAAVMALDRAFPPIAGG